MNIFQFLMSDICSDMFTIHDPSDDTEKSNHTLLLVEDDPIISLAETKLLKKDGYAVIQAYTGESALEIISSNAVPVDLILMDINLGDGIDGIETAREILKANNFPIIFLSTYTDVHILKKIETVASFGYVVKNTSRSVLNLNIKMALNLYASFKKLKHDLEWHNNRDYYKVLYEVGFNSMFVNDKEIAIDANQKFCHMFGYTIHEILGRDIIALIINNEYKNIVYEKALNQNMLPHRILSHDKQGTDIWIELMCLPYSYNGKELKLVTIRRLPE